MRYSLSKPNQMIAAFLLLTIGACTMVFAADPVGPNLTPRLKKLLATEMQQVSKATAELAVAIACGDHGTVSDLGEKVRDSFILKQSLTPEDKKDLIAAVPPAFIAMDKQFHGLAGKLSGAGRGGDSELQGFYYARMLDACVQCHSRYASDRFSGLGTKK